MRGSLGIVAVVVALGSLLVSEVRGQAPAGAVPAQALVIDHRSIADFRRLPDEYIHAAAQLRFLMRSASIGANIDQGLSCLADDFPGRTRRPYFCDRDIPAGQVVYDRKYDRRNWTIEMRGNPGWWDKLRDFERRVNGLAPQEFRVVSFNFNYADGVPGSFIADRFFKTETDTRFGNVMTLEALEKKHPDKTIVWWTMALPRQSSIEMRTFNQQMRSYARSHHKVLMDLADIESHQRDGSPCVDNQGAGLEAICQDYTNERNSGHLNALGIQRAAQAMWVLMAHLAGWNG